MFRNTELLKIAACVPLGIFYSASTARNGRPILALLVVVVVALLGLVVDESAFVALGVVVLVVVRVEVHLVQAPATVRVTQNLEIRSGPGFASSFESGSVRS